MLRTIAAAIIGVHALIHVIGFVVPWRLVEISGFAYRTTAPWRWAMGASVPSVSSGLDWPLASALRRSPSGAPGRGRCR